MDEEYQKEIQEALKARREKSKFQHEARQAVQETEEKERPPEEEPKDGLWQKLVEQISKLGLTKKALQYINVIKNRILGQKALEEGKASTKQRSTIKKSLWHKADNNKALFYDLDKETIEKLKEDANINDSSKLITGVLSNKEPFIAFVEEEDKGNITHYHIISTDRKIQVDLPSNLKESERFFNYIDLKKNAISSGVADLSNDSVKITRSNDKIERIIEVHRNVGFPKIRTHCTLTETLGNSGFEVEVREWIKGGDGINMCKFYDDDSLEQPPSEIQYCNISYYREDDGLYHEKGNSDVYTEKDFDGDFRLLSTVKKMRTDGFVIPQEILEICDKTRQINVKEEQGNEKDTK